MDHAITYIEPIPPDGIRWACTCSAFGTCPRPIAWLALADHLSQPEPDRPEPDSGLRYV